MSKVWGFVKQYWPTVAPVLAAAALGASDAAQQELAKYPKTAFVAALVGMVLAHWKKSPKDGQNK